MREYGKGALPPVIFCKISWFALSLVLFLAAGACAAVTVQGRVRQAEAEELEQIYRGKEAELVWSIRTYLNRQGFSNSGVTMTHIVDRTGQRSYLIRVHHRRINALDEAGRAELADAVLGLCFLDENCSFRTEFL